MSDSSDASAAQLHESGVAELRSGRFAAAILLLQKAVAQRSDLTDAWVHLGNAYYSMEQFNDSAGAYQTALRLQPGYAQVYSNLGTALWKRGDLDEAVAECGKSIELKPDFAEAWSNLGNILQDLGRMDEAIAAGRKAMELQPNQAWAHFNLGVSLLKNGDYEEGWRHYAWRWQVPGFEREPRSFSQPIWDGSDLAGRRILLHAEQGFGDAIQFARFVPLVARRGARVILECAPRLLNFLRSLEGVEQMAAYGEALPPFDVHCPLLTLPAMLQTTLRTIPATVPYLTADPAKASNWALRLANDSAKLKVGVAWAAARGPARGARAERSIPFKFLDPLARIAGVSLYSLQKGEGASQIHGGDASIRIFDWTAELTDFADTAALVSNLDIVISIDGVIAHVAGALAKRTWILLPHASEWRWLLNRTDSPWYPTARLFRQPTPGDWESVVRGMCEVLGSLRG